ncbi:3-oxoacyl-ACP synthase III family protein [Phenylobacterium sp.]|uniref:3-oxoacyl-ACP synthase III family protein n=1 Tax=Phenylobacterium sp. TaxID=1871053 RepID=UPI001226CEDC|nr:ketoacyl-ACP synthase III [Phenylobacterium sp.]THD64088.1 MAG: ketoacyl-ACP synthase III [Phenylobacterium sp.]
MPEATAPTGSSLPGYSVPGVALRGVVSCVPARRVTNDYFKTRFSDDDIADVIKMIGVEARHWAADGQTTADLCRAAAGRLLERLAWEPSSVDALIFVSQTPNQRLPATSCELHADLGLAPACQAFDVALGCSGYTYGLWLAAAMINAGCRRVLLLAGETSSRIVDPADRGTALLFGDAGTATALEASPGATPMHFVLGTDGTGAQNLIVQGGGFRAIAPDARRAEGYDPEQLFMDGGAVFSFTLKAVPALVRDTLSRAEATSDDIDALVLHQANRFMLNHIAKKVGVGPERTPINIDRFGNTSSATLPLVLSTDLAERLMKEPMRLMLAGFGVGYSWGGVYMTAGPLGCAETITQ